MSGADNNRRTITMAQKIYTTSGKKIIRTESYYDRFIRLQLELGNDFKSAIKEWHFLNCKIKIVSQNKYA
jgi:hypothetical protein